MKPMVIVRCLTATTLFLMLAKVNVWTNTSTHIILAVGYRALLLSAPAFMCLGLNRGLRYSLVIGLLSAVSLFYSINPISIFFFALSMAVSGYICKYVNSKTIKGAADNKVSLNIGSMISGGLILIISMKSLLLGLCVAMLAVTVFYSFRLDLNEEESQKTTEHIKVKPPIDLLGFTRWSFIGIATGIKLTGIFAILPQYFLHKLGTIPNWYGSLVMINSFGVILFQHKILYWLEKLGKAWTWIFASSAMLLLASPSVLAVEHIIPAILWISLLTFGECALSRYDKVASDEGFLFRKEFMVGAGSFITVYLSREYSHAIYISGFLGILCMVLSSICYAFQSSKIYIESQKKVKAPIVY
jgi:hypothetical protein